MREKSNTPKTWFILINL